MKCYRSGGCGPQFEMLSCSECPASKPEYKNAKNYPPYLDYPKERKKHTNADKYFRNATDEEIVEAWYYVYHNVIFASTNSRQGLLDWLKQEVKSDG